MAAADIMPGGFLIGLIVGSAAGWTLGRYVTKRRIRALCATCKAAETPEARFASWRDMTPEASGGLWLWAFMGLLLLVAFAVGRPLVHTNAFAAFAFAAVLSALGGFGLGRLTHIHTAWAICRFCHYAGRPSTEDDIYAPTWPDFWP